MKTLYLHIGTPKTATTAIQFFLDDNKERLQERGYAYPRFPFKYPWVNRRRNGHFIHGIVKDAEGKRDRKEEERRFQECMKQVEELFCAYDHIILSDEALWDGLLRWHDHVWERLLEESERQGFVLKIIVYLRRQDQYVYSMWSQKVKTSFSDQGRLSWEEFLYHDPPVAETDYYRVLKRISAHIGQENVIVRRFERRHMKQHSIYEDFLDALGIQMDNSFVIAESERNLHLSGNVREIKKAMNEIPSMKEKETYHFFLEILLQVSRVKPDEGKTSMFSGEETREYMARFEEDNRRIMQEYFGQEGDLFATDYSDTKKWIRERESMFEDRVLVMGETFIALRERNRNLKESIDLAEAELGRQRERLNDTKTKLRHPARTLAAWLQRNR